ncbi:MAG: hypothetical protein ABIG64_01825 [Candidatus Omnitrophota bacterium]
MTPELKGHGIPFDPIDFDLEEPIKQDFVQSQEPALGDKPTLADAKKPQLPKKKFATRFVLIFFVLLALSAIGVAAYYYLGKEEEISKRIEVEATLATVKEEKVIVEKNLDEITLQRDQLQVDVEESKSNYKRLLVDFEQEQNANKKLASELDKSVKQITSLKKVLDKEVENNAKISAKLTMSSREYEDIKLQLSQIRMAKEALENRILQMNKKQSHSGVELEKIVVNSSPQDLQPETDLTQETTKVNFQNSPLQASKPVFIPLPPPARLEGQVLVVNKEFAFVVINIGEKDGIKNSEVLDVYHGLEKVGKVQIERIYDTMSSAIIIPESTKQQIKEGDIVRLM